MKNPWILCGDKSWIATVSRPSAKMSPSPLPPGRVASEISFCKKIYKLKITNIYHRGVYSAKIARNSESQNCYFFNKWLKTVLLYCMQNDTANVKKAHESVGSQSFAKFTGNLVGIPTEC